MTIARRAVRCRMAFLLTVISGGGMAGPLVITGIDAEEVEARVGNEIVYLEASRLGAPPIEVLSRDGKGYLQIRDARGEKVWINSGDVLTSDLDSVRRNCTSSKVASAGDRKQYGIRGVGEKCP